MAGRVLDEHDYAELARSLACSESVVRQRVSRGPADVEGEIGANRMTYLPELRESLVKAARRQAQAPVAAPVAARPRRVRRGFGGLVLIGASLAALVVAGAVLVLVGHRSPSPPASPAAAAYGSRPAARAAAAAILSAFRAPAGAVAVSSDLSRPRRLGWPNDGLPVPSAIDLHRFYRVAGDPQAVINAITPRRSFPGALAGAANPYSVSEGGSSSSAGSAGPGSSKIVIETATATFPLGSVGGIAREVQVGVASAGPGMTALRVDAQAWWLVPRPAGENIPNSVTSILVQRLGRLPRVAKTLHPIDRLDTPAQVREAVSLLNSLGARQPSQGACAGTQGLRFRLVFLGSGQHPDPVAVIEPNCGVVTLSLAGRPQPPLSWAGANFVPLYQFLERLAGRAAHQPLGARPRHRGLAGEFIEQRADNSAHDHRRCAPEPDPSRALTRESVEHARTLRGSRRKRAFVQRMRPAATRCTFLSLSEQYPRRVVPGATGRRFARLARRAPR